MHTKTTEPTQTTPTNATTKNINPASTIFNILY